MGDKIKRCCKDCGAIRSTLIDLTLKKFQSNYHEQAWEKFDKIGMYRCLGSQLFRFLMFIGYSIMGAHAWHETERFLEEDGPPNRGLVESIFPYAKTAIIMLNCGRIVLFLIGLKWL